MGNVVRFQCKTEVPQRAADSSKRIEQPCTIVIFPGVRYERWADETTPQSPAPAPKRRRRRQR